MGVQPFLDSLVIRIYYSQQIHKTMTYIQPFRNLLTLCFLTFSILAFGQNTESRSVDSFHKLAVSGNFETLILEKDREGVELRGSASDLEKIEIENDGKTLEIKVKKRKKLRGKVYVAVGFQELTRIANSGSTDIISKSTIEGDAFALAFSGSGDFEGSFDVETLKVAISGSADFDLEGRADHQTIAISGSGDVDLNVSGRVKSAVSGSGDVSNRG